MIAPNVPTLEEIRDEFVALLPGLAGRLSTRFCHRDPEAQADAIAEAIGLAWTLYMSARQRNRTVSAGNLAYYAGRSVEVGRKVAGASGLDALSETSLARDRIGTHASLEQDGLSQDRFLRTFGDTRWRWPVIDYVAPHLDFEAFQATCRPQDRKIMAMKVQGIPQRQIARELGVSSPAVSQRLRVLRARWDAMGGT